MLKEQNWIVSRVMQITELSLVAGSFFLSYYIRNYFFPDSFTTMLPVGEYAWIVLLIIPLWGILLKFNHIFGTFEEKFTVASFGKLLLTHFWGIMILGSVIFLFQKKYFSRSLIIIFVILSLLILTLFKLFISFIFPRIKSFGFLKRNILIVGVTEEALRIAKTVTEHKKWGLNLFGFVKPDTEVEESLNIAVDENKILCNVSSMPELIHDNVIDEVIICLPGRNISEIEYLLSFCEEEGVRARLALEYYPMVIAKPSLEYFHGKPLLTFNTTPDRNFELFLKRLLDMSFSFLGLILFSPLFLLVAVAIKVSGEGPVIFSQKRVGLAGRNFTIYKFRSMKIDSEKSIGNLIPLNERDGPVFKIRKDPRITPVGKIIRATYIDELPQLVNVFLGDMSLVGPRPPLPSEVTKYERWQRRRLSLKPGMTCFWQISDRKSNMSFSDWMKLDLKYIDEWSLGTDLKILIRTLPKVIKGFASIK